MSKSQMAVFVVLGSLVSVLIWSFVGGCQRPGPEPAPRAAPPRVDPPAETEEELRREGIIRDRPPLPAASPLLTPPPPPPSPPPPSPAVERHTVARGETLWGISREYGVSVESLKRANNITDPSALAVGRTLVIPRD